MFFFVGLNYIVNLNNKFYLNIGSIANQIQGLKKVAAANRNKAKS